MRSDRHGTGPGPPRGAYWGGAIAVAGGREGGGGGGRGGRGRGAKRPWDFIQKGPDEFPRFFCGIFRDFSPRIRIGGGGGGGAGRRRSPVAGSRRRSAAAAAAARGEREEEGWLSIKGGVRAIRVERGR
jgi:hypothetical protein